MGNQPDEAAVPKDIALQLPALNLLHAVLAADILTLPVGVSLIRGAWQENAVWPAAVTHAGRFGPPKELTSVGSFPFYWIYAAEQEFTAAWEAQLCLNPVPHPGQFIIAPGAEHALIAELRFDQPLSLFDLTGQAASKLGIYDQLRSPDHRWCQWLGWQLDQLIAFQAAAVHGIRYPSRRHPAHNAYAISSRAQLGLTRGMSWSVRRFSDCKQFAQLLCDPCRIDPLRI